MNNTSADTLLKEAMDLIEDVFVNPTNDTTVSIRAIEISNKYRELLSSPPSAPPAMTWEECLDKIGVEAGYERWKQFSYYLSEQASAIEPWIYPYLEKAAQLYLESNREQPWIPVEERLPKENQLVTHWLPQVYGVCRYKDDNFWYAGEIIFPTHWQPLPEIPKR